MAALLDVNVLLALAWPNHIHHEAAHDWFTKARSRGWATCLLTQAAFVRLSSQPTVVKTTVSVAEALRILEINISTFEHVLWPIEHGITELHPEIRERLMGHHQLTDALLLDLAIRKQGKVATFDRRIAALLRPDSELRSVIEVLPVG